MTRCFLPLLAAALLWPAALSAGEKKADPAETIAKLIDNLKKKDDPNARLQAAMELAEFGPAAKDAVPQLVDLLKNGDEDLKLNAALALGKIGKAAVAPVTEVLAAKDDDARFYAIWTLGWIGPDAAPAAPQIIKLLDDKNDGVRRKAVFAVGRIGAEPEKTIPILIKAFQDKDHDVQTAAGEAVAKFGGKAVPALIKALEDAKTKRQAAVSLGSIGSEAKAAVPALLKALLASEKEKDESPMGDPTVLPVAPGGGFGRPIRGPRPFPFPGMGDEHFTTGNVYADALAKIGKSAIPALEEALKTGNERTRNAVLQAFGKIGADAVPTLVDALGDKRVDVRRAAAQVLGPMRVGDKLVVSGLAYSLKHDADDMVRQYALSALQQLGPAGKDAAPTLLEALSDVNVNVRQQAFYTLQGMGVDMRPGLKKALDHKESRVRINTAALMLTTGIDPDLALPVLIDGLKEKDVAIRLQAAHALAVTNRERDKVLPTLIEGLKNESPAIRAQALQALQQMGPAASSAGVAIVALLEDPEANVRQHALWAIQNIRPEAKLVMPALVKMMKHSDVGLRQQAVWALQNMGGDLKAVKDDVVALLKTDDVNLRTNIMPLLGRMGEDGVNLLMDGLEDKEPQVRWTAAQALQNLRGAAKPALPALVKHLGDDNQNVRVNCVFALTNMGNEGVDALLKAVPDLKHEDARVNAMQNLIYGPHRAKVVPLVLEGLKSKAAGMRLSCVHMVQNIGRFPDAIPSLEKILTDDTDANIRQASAFALGNQGPDGWKALEKAFPSVKDGTTRLGIVQSFMNYNVQPKGLIPELVACLKDSNNQLRWMTCAVLGNMGAAAKEAAPAIESLLRDSDPTVQAHARNALMRMGVTPKSK
ncbi:MAG: HEAT repeat domain-containing protein [Gemmataceae bacterium]